MVSVEPNDVPTVVMFNSVNSLKHHVQTQRWILLLFVVEFKIFITDTQYFLALQKGRNRKCTKVSSFLKRWCEIEKELYILKRHP